MRSGSSHHETPVSETAVGSVVAQIGVDVVMMETYKAEELPDGLDVLGDIGVERYVDGCGATIRQVNFQLRHSLSVAWIHATPLSSAALNPSM